MNIQQFYFIFKLTIPVAMAYVPLGLALGVFMVSSGIQWFWAPLSALIIFAGSIEFLAVSFIISGLPLAAIAWTTLIVNFRHLFYGLSFPLSSFSSRWQKIYGIYALTDETYGITSAGAGQKLRDSEITLLQVISHLWWVGGALFGAFVGTIIPPEIKGFEFALTAMFVTLAVDAVRHHRENQLILYAVISSVAGILSERYIAEHSFLATGLICYLILISKDYKTECKEVLVHDS
ncbi:MULTISPECIES: AzlC family ABC transporter permease [unclassified Photobacterium]|uniref:AzlC family ABC transporter permease n=1 Tax=unclassified Photobacterium TaxID=2628852 RepID=UPI001B8D7679|nr:MULTISPECIES: AzlC family ABC transporter permease [unclassified Photobacterium]MDO6705838.1 AzlC family ABC transporter permease [Photobacterium sp. 1_MG-2023]QUJ69369.1 AzlC family ABC transporter permease [Photobacterium sp. GJ3]